MEKKNLITGSKSETEGTIFGNHWATQDMNKRKNEG